MLFPNIGLHGRIMHGPFNCETSVVENGRNEDVKLSCQLGVNLVSRYLWFRSDFPLWVW